AKGKQGLFKYQFLLTGKVMSATAYVSSGGRYRFSVNGIAISMDTSVSRSFNKLDSFDVKGQLTGGDNSVALSFIKGESGIKLRVKAVVDTSLHFASNMGLVSPGGAVPKKEPVQASEEKVVVDTVKKSDSLPVQAKAPEAKADTVKPSKDSVAVAAKQVVDTLSAAPKDTLKPEQPKSAPASDQAKKEVKTDSIPAPMPAKQTAAVQPKDTVKTAVATAESFKNYDEFAKALADAKLKNEELKKEVKSTQTRIRSIKFRLGSTDEAIRSAENDIKVYRKIIESKSQR
ncbi:MAG: hypothetical protein JNL74_15100, partial [Fibrobacteres bacterium]|nr:hypothetical protein [Fibrobacterota bacterium]